MAGKVKAKTKKERNAEGKTVKVEIPGEWDLAAASAKEIGARAVRALTNPSTNVGRLIRGQPLRPDEPDVAVEAPAT